jgi:hypothetical protein
MQKAFEPQLIKVGKKTKRVSLQRYLLSRIVYETEKVKEAEIVCLFENQLWLEQKSFKDLNFFRKFCKEIFLISKLLKEVDLRSFDARNINRLSSRIEKQLPCFLIPVRNYAQWKSRFSGRFTFNPQTLNKELQEFYRNNPPEPERVRGYRDKGSKRDLAKDGSPTWQEVSAVTPLENYEREIQNAKTYEDIVFTFAKIFPSVKEKLLNGGDGILSPPDPEKAPRKNTN